jgi:hypothetical protein
VARPLADPARVDYAMVLKVYQPIAGEPLSPRTTQALEGADQ